MSFNFDPPPSTIRDFTFQWKTWLNNLYEWLRINVGTDFYTEVAKGNVIGHSLVHKFGTALLTTTPAVISQTGAYQVPMAAVTLEFVSSDANDTVAGSGAQEVTVMGLDLNWNEVTTTVETDGVTAVIIDTDFIRIFRWFVSRSGTYASSSISSHAGVLTLQVSGGGTVWDTIPIVPFPIGQSVIGAYTIPKGKAGYLLSKQIFVDSTKTADIYFFQRAHADDVTPPYSGVRRIVEREVGIAGTLTMDFRSPKGPFVGPCDVGFIGSVSVSDADASAEFELLLVDD